MLLCEYVTVSSNYVNSTKRVKFVVLCRVASDDVDLRCREQRQSRDHDLSINQSINQSIYLSIYLSMITGYL